MLQFWSGGRNRSNMERTPVATRTTCCKSLSENMLSCVLTNLYGSPSCCPTDGTVRGSVFSAVWTLPPFPQTPKGSKAPPVYSKQVQEVQPALLGHAGASVEANLTSVGPSDRRPAGRCRHAGPSGATVGWKCCSKPRFIYPTVFFFVCFSLFFFKSLVTYFLDEMYQTLIYSYWDVKQEIYPSDIWHFIKLMSLVQVGRCFISAGRAS